MKLNLEFEGPDLRDLIEEYFKRRGFKVKNLDALCVLFEKVYPNGITVKAETLAPQERTTPVETLPGEEIEVTVSADKGQAKGIIEESGGKKSNGSPNVAMSTTDLFDPTPGMVPSRDEQLRQSQQEVANIVAQSKALAEEKAKETE